jgi:hypothetical protein
MSYDFNISNYTIHDLEKFFNLSSEYNEYEIVEKEKNIRKKIANAIQSEPNKKKIERNLFVFLDEAKNLLVKEIKSKMVKKEDLIIANKNEFVSMMASMPPINTFPTNVAHGNLNTLKKRTTSYSLCMNTLFRDTTGSTSTDAVFILPYPLKNVVNMKLTSFEFPDTVYMISDKRKTNRFFMKEDTTGKQGMIILPEGKYNSENLPGVLEKIINDTLDTENRFSVCIDQHSRKTIIKNSEHSFAMQFINNETNQLLSKNLGWYLGFRSANYIRGKCFKSEGVFNSSLQQYLYFVLNDFNISNATRIMGIFLDNYVEKNILAKIPIPVDSFQIMFDNNSDLISKKREYHGTVDINKFSVKLLDIYGEMLDINCMDYSFTLEFEIAYDI